MHIGSMICDITYGEHSIMMISSVIHYPKSHDLSIATCIIANGNHVIVEIHSAYKIDLLESTVAINSTQQPVVKINILMYKL